MRRIYEQSKVFLRFIHYQLMKSHEINSGHISICQFREEIRNRYEEGEPLSDHNFGIKNGPKSVFFACFGKNV